MDTAGLEMSIEIEKKYRLTNQLRVRLTESLPEIGAEFVGEDREENIIFSNRSLSENHAVVRIRKTDSKSILTFKQRLESQSAAKQQIEFETKVDDVDSLSAILHGIGLRPAIVYEKKRRTYRLRDAEVVLDELPFGLFMEIEGSLTAIAEIEMLLEIEDVEVEHQTYPRLASQFGVRNGETIESRFSS